MNTTNAPKPQPRSLRNAVLRGFSKRCPKCGKGRLFRSYTKVNDTCPHCAEELYHQQADDFPAYIVVGITGITVLLSMVQLQIHTTIAPWIYLVVLIPLTTIIALILLPHVKGAVIGMQWARYMHGFRAFAPNTAEDFDVEA